MLTSIHPRLPALVGYSGRHCVLNKIPHPLEIRNTDTAYTAEIFLQTCRAGAKMAASHLPHWAAEKASIPNLPIQTPEMTGQVETTAGQKADG